MCVYGGVVSVTFGETEFRDWTVMWVLKGG